MRRSRVGYLAGTLAVLVLVVGCGLGRNDDSQARRRGFHILGADRVTIHLCAIERRQIGVCNDVLGQDAPECLMQFDPFAPQRLSLLPNDLYRFRNRNH